jgi:molybdenum cofactor synthesis domain-containing protein
MTPIGIVTISDSRSAGSRADTTTALIRRVMEEAGYAVGQVALIPDEAPHITAVLIDMAARHALPLVLTSGGTGFGPRDVTPEATRAVIERDAPGLAEAMRTVTAATNALAWLSRGIAGIRGRTLIVNLPGSPRAVEECLRALLPLLPHALEMIEGRPHGSDAPVVAGS